MASSARRTDPELWEEIKAEVTTGDKGGRKRQWSARKAQFAVQEYKRRGGGYQGEKRTDNSLQRWTEEDWGTKSGRKSGESGERYLPKKAREAVSDEEYARTTEKKRRDSARGRQFSGQPEDVRRRTARYRHGGKSDGGGEPSKAELYEEARRQDIEGRSKMSKAELVKALER
jgi:alkanesulfonate monooxygenase SsuD/methylene tetrahydromethanopterin reductase-like flavin-dependent oxidoreductase (luciferase family)